MLSTSIAQTYFLDDFSDQDMSDWIKYDVDGDNNQWDLLDLTGYNAELGHSMVSFSTDFDSNNFDPDNYVVSPAIDLTNATGEIVLDYTYGSGGAVNNHQETYSVYVTTANNLATLQGATAIHNETIANAESIETNSLDLSAYAGQTIYVTFRHHDTPNAMLALFIDDIVVRTPLDSDAILRHVDLIRYSLPSVDNTLSMEVKNNGNYTISTLEVNWNDGTDDHISTINVNIPVASTISIDHPIPVNYANIVEANITVTITAVNGAVDGDTANNVQNDILFNTLSQSSPKAVLIEEHTGTWCGWCPRGAVALEHIATTYPDTAVTIAVHNSDPMTVSEYDSGLASITGGGYPNSSFDRTTTIAPSTSAFEAAYNTRISGLKPVTLDVNASISGSDLTITANATFYTNINAANFKLGAIIIENGVTGTSSGYDQVNYYAGGGEGAMGGYENLPDPVPAAQMVYDHVGRELLGGFNGQDNSIPVSSITDGDNFQYTFNYTIPATSNQNNMYIALVLIDSNTGAVINATQKSINNALSTSDLELVSNVTIYPNPATDKFNIGFDTSSAKNFTITVTDMLGRTVLSQQHKNLDGNNTIAISTHQFNAGQYIVTIATPKTSYSKRLIVNN
ncbi:MAG: Omp28-related outer membrane protein [Flavobacteriaceae bacterium]|nr:Omp28-related outer membrane protein [Flavobacteriaceae bacterium]